MKTYYTDFKKQLKSMYGLTSFNLSLSLHPLIFVNIGLHRRFFQNY